MPLSKEAAMSRKIQFVFLFLLLGLLSTAAQLCFAQAGPPLNFANNYFVRGDYTVAGAQGMTSNFTNIKGIQYAVGTITVPDDLNPGNKPSAITGSRVRRRVWPSPGCAFLTAVFWRRWPSER